MRFFCCILSIYFVFLTAIPCIDQPLQNHLEESGIGGTTHHQHHEGDECSPFCTCNCCGTTVIQQEFLVHFDDFTILQEYDLPEYNSVITSDYLKSIWQPPQLA